MITFTAMRRESTEEGLLRLIKFEIEKERAKQGDLKILEIMADGYQIYKDDQET